MYKNYTTLSWILFWGILTIMLGWLAQQTQESWTFYIVVASFVILIGGLIWQLIKRLQILKVEVRYLIPKQNYPNGVLYQGAPETEKYPHTLTVGIGLYTLFIQFRSNKDIIVDPIRILFEGSIINKPKIESKDNPFVRERLADGSYRDWWGDIQQSAKEYPRPIYRKDLLMDGNRINTYGIWKGKIKIEIPIRGIGIIEKQLDFIVSTKDDNIPFLKVNKNQVAIISDSTTNISKPCINNDK